MKTLTVYYSRGGNTAKAAKAVQKFAGGDIFEIKGTKNYGNYFQALGVARSEFSSGELPEVVGDVEDFDSYDRILIGFPIWYSKAPQLVVSFIKSHDFTGKDVYVFCTSGMSGPSQAIDQIKPALKGANLHKAIRLGKFEDKDLEEWLEEDAENAQE